MNTLINKNKKILNPKHPVPWAFNTIAQAACLRAKQTPDDIAHYFEHGVSVSYAKAWRDTQALAVSLKSMGLVPGDVVSFQLPNWYEAVLINLAAACLGLVVNAIVPIYRGRELKFMLNKANTKALFIPDSFRNFSHSDLIDTLKPDLPALEHVVLVRPNRAVSNDFAELLKKDADIEPLDANIDDIKLLLFTSGTTGEPKGVMHSHRSLAWAIQNCCDFWSVTEADLMFMPSPVTHITGYTFGMELPYFNHTPSALMEQWQVTSACEWIDNIGATLCVGATPFLQELTEAAMEGHYSLASLRLFACGGAVVPPEIIYRANKMLPACLSVRVYGSSEVPIITLGFVLPEQIELAANTDGEVFRYQVKIVKDDGTLAAMGEEGEIFAKGAAMMCGYMDPFHQQSACDELGYFKTGDLGHLTLDKAIVISGRKKDLIIRGGENISAREIEEVLNTYTGIREVAVVAMPHKRLGETICAYLVTDGQQISLQQVCDFCAQVGLSKQKWPQHIESISSLPKTPSGKVQKYLLRQQILHKVNAG